MKSLNISVYPRLQLLRKGRARGGSDCDLKIYQSLYVCAYEDRIIAKFKDNEPTILVHISEPYSCIYFRCISVVFPS